MPEGRGISVVPEIKKRHWFFTTFNFVEEKYEDIFEHINKKNVIYYAYQMEVCPDTKRKHIHGVISFKHPTSFNIMSMVVPGGHFKYFDKKNMRPLLYSLKLETRCKGPVYYGDVPKIFYNYEFGSTEYKKVKIAMSNFNTINYMVNKYVKNAQALDFTPSQYSYTNEAFYDKFKGMIEKIYEQTSDPKYIECPIIFHSGSPGSGKTTLTETVSEHLEYKRYESTLENNFEDINIGEADIYIKDEANPSNLNLQKYNELATNAKMRHNIKGSSIRANIKMIVINSNYKLDEIIEGVKNIYGQYSKNMLNSFLRRLTMYVELETNETDNKLNMILTTYKRNKKGEILDYIEARCDKEFINIRDNKLLKMTYYESLLKAIEFIDKKDKNIVTKINKIIKS